MIKLPIPKRLQADFVEYMSKRDKDIPTMLSHYVLKSFAGEFMTTHDIRRNRSAAVRFYLENKR